MDALIVYYTWSGNTGKLAKLIGQETGGNLFEIRPQSPYSSDYSTCVEQAKKEIKVGYLPMLEALPENLDAYDTVFVGTPNWWSTLAPPVSTFLTKVNLAEKTVVPFCTHGGGGQARCTSDTVKLCRGTKVLDGLAFYGGNSSQKEVFRWLSGNGLAR